MSAVEKQPIVPTFSQGNIIPALIITAVAVLFYYDGLQVYTYLGGVKACAITRPVVRAIEDLSFIFSPYNPIPFHVIVLGLHAANSILVFLILKKVVDNRVGLFGALFFTSFFAHPEVVTYSAGLNEVLRTFFLLSWMILFYKYRENPTKTNYVLTLGAFILALLSKESTALLWPLMYLVDRYIQMESRDRSGGKPNKNFYIPYIPFIMISTTWPLLLLPVFAPNLLFMINPAEFHINLYLSAITSFNICLLKGPGYGTLFLVFSLVLSFLPIFDIRAKRRIILLWVGWLVTIIPLIMAGMNLRYLYITSAFSMAIFATCVCHSIAYVSGRLRLKEAYVTFLTILTIAVPVTTNFFYVRRHVEYLKDAGRLSESLLRPILIDFTAGTLGTKLVFINFPYIYEPPPGSGYIGARHALWTTDLFTMFTTVYVERNAGAFYLYTVPELYDGRHPLIGAGAPRLSPLELEKLAMEEDARVYIFNPGNDTVLDVTGRDYNSLRKLISNKGED